MNLRQFFRLVEQQAATREYTGKDLLNSALYLLAGKARLHFLNNSQNWKTWSDLKKSFRLKFMPDTLDFNMLDKIVERRQGEGEATLDYLESMQGLFNGMESQAHEDMQIHYMIRGMRSEIKTQVKPFTKSFKTVDDLTRHCKIIEENLDRKDMIQGQYKRLNELSMEEQTDKILESFMLRYFEPKLQNNGKTPFQPRQETNRGKIPGQRKKVQRFHGLEGAGALRGQGNQPARREL